MASRCVFDQQIKEKSKKFPGFQDHDVPKLPKIFLLKKIKGHRNNQQTKMTRPQLIIDNTTIACDWRVRTYDCVDSQAFKDIWWAAFACCIITFAEILFFIVFKMSSGSYRLFQGRSFRGNEGSALFAAIATGILAAYALINIFEASTSQVVLELLYSLPQFTIFVSYAIYASALIRLLPTRYWDYVDEKTRSVILPSRKKMKVMILVAVAVTFVFDVILPCFLGMLAIDASALNKQDMSKERLALARINRVTIVLFSGNFSTGLGDALLANVYSIYSLIPLSKFAMILTVLTVWAIGFVNYSSEFLPYIWHALWKGTANIKNATTSSKDESHAPPYPSKGTSSDLKKSKDPLDVFMNQTEVENV